MGALNTVLLIHYLWQFLNKISQIWKKKKSMKQVVKQELTVFSEGKKVFMQTFK